MTSVWMRARAELRSHVAGALVLVVIVGVIGGVVIAAAAGARRTSSAYPRLLQEEHALTLVAEVQAQDADTARSVLGQVERLPQVAASSLVQLANGRLRIPGRQGAGQVAAIVSVDGRFGNTINGLKILAGRTFDPNAPDEIVPSFSVAENLGLHVGQTVRLLYGGFFGNGQPLTGPPPSPVELHVVGIAAAPGFFEPLAGGYIPAVVFPPAFARVHHDYMNDADLNAALVLRHGVADQRAFIEEIRRLREHLPPRSRIGFPFNQAQQTSGVQQATHVQAIALWVLAALVGLAGIAVFAQALARQTILESLEYPTLRALGMSRRQLVGIGVIRATLVGIGAAVIAVVVGYALSPLSPTGLARVAEPHPGFAFDGVVIGIGAVATLLLVVLVSAIPAWRASRLAGNALGTAELPGAERPSAVAGFLSRAAFPPSATAGVRMALEPGRGRTAVPVRSAMLGATLSLVALAGALVFGSSLTHLVDTPSLSGWNWDLVAFQAPGSNTAEVEGFLERSPRVQGYAVGTVGNVTVDGNGTFALAMDSRKGGVTPSVIEGRAPDGADEVMVGTELMRRLGLDLGDSVEVTGRAGGQRMRIVGRLAMPAFFFSTSRPGQGVALSVAGADRVMGTQSNGPGEFVRLAPGVRPSAFAVELRRRGLFVLPRLESQQVHVLGGAGRTPLMLAGILALMAAATLGHTLTTSIRRRRLDLAILKTLGFSRRQVSSAVAWQASSLALVALVIGLPLGVVSGRWAWTLFADRMGVVPDAVIPILAVLLAVPATIVLANLLAVVPGRIASHLKPGPVLRSE